MMSLVVLYHNSLRIFYINFYCYFKNRCHAGSSMLKSLPRLSFFASSAHKGAPEPWRLAARMESLPVILRKGGPFLERLGERSSVQRAVCPREKLFGFIDESGHLVIHLLSDDLQGVEIDRDAFLK